ncbi:MAG: class I SAM-dependent methyltransferase [Chloroflexi bacterium]|nr:class I SAM-dependent methyltransferase [Chloroflexota bacterium]
MQAKVRGLLLERLPWDDQGEAVDIGCGNGALTATLPFADGQFDAAMSNLAFHATSDARDKREPVRETLRVIKKGGGFAFQDLFLWKTVYGEVDDLLVAVWGWGVERVEFVDTSYQPCIPKALKLPFMLGTSGILHGRR